MVSVLNLGWVRREFRLVLDTLQRVARHEIVVLDESTTCGRPIEWNQLSIARRVVEAKADVWLSMDADTVPLGNPLDPIDGDYDVLGYGYLIDGSLVPIWSAAVPEDAEDGKFRTLYPTDKTIESYPGMVVGGGCWAISRRVLESLLKRHANPFTRRVREDGSLVGNDFSFCERAWAAGFQVFICWEPTAEHYKEVPRVAAWNAACDAMERRS